MTPDAKPGPQPGPGIFYGYIIAAAAFFILLAAYGVRFAYGVFFNPMAAELGWSSATTSAAYSISMIMEGLFSFIMGGLSDRLGPRVVLTASAVMVGLGYGLIPLTQNVWQFYLFYGLLVGIGMGGMFVPLVAVIARWFTARRTLMTGIVSSGTGIGLIVVSPLAAQLIISLGWRFTFVIMGLAIMIVTLVAAQFLKRDPASMGLLPYGEKDVAAGPGKAAAVRGFSFREAVRTRQFWFIFLMVFWFGFYSTAFNVHIVPDAIRAGMPPLTAANILPVSGAVLIIGRIGLGSAADRVGNKLIFYIGFTVAIAAFLGLAFNPSYWLFFAVAALIGFSNGGVGTAQSPLLASLFGLRSHGLIYGLVGTGFTSGSALGPFVTGVIVDRTGSYPTAFLVCAVTCILALGLVFLIRPVKDSPLTTARL